VQVFERLAVELLQQGVLAGFGSSEWFEGAVLVDFADNIAAAAFLVVE
jgi:hypothetical protein